jgi:cell division protein FtsB
MPVLGRPQAADRAKFTSRAAVLAVVICAIALSLAYPVREYIDQGRQIDQLQAEHQLLTTQLRQLEQQQGRMNDPTYVEQLARNKLHLCLRGATCYVVIDSQPGHSGAQASAASLTPWYERVWQSVQQANRGSSKSAR